MRSAFRMAFVLRRWLQCKVGDGLLAGEVLSGAAKLGSHQAEGARRLRSISPRERLGRHGDAHGASPYVSTFHLFICVEKRTLPW